MAGRGFVAAVVIGLVALVAGIAVGSQLAAKTSTVTIVETLSPTTVTKTITSTQTATVTSVLTVTKTSTVTVTATRPPSHPARIGWPRVIIDAMGRNVTIPEPPARVASLSPAITETLCALNVLDRLVAADKYSLTRTRCLEAYLARVNKSIVNVGGYWWNTINTEKLVKSKPDLVIAEVGAHAKLLRKFEELHLPVIYVHGGSAKSITQVYQDILEIGYALGVENRAYQWVSRMKHNITLIEEKLAKVNETPVLIILWWSPEGAWVPGGDTFIADMVRVAKGRLLTSKFSGWQAISLEEMASLASNYASKGLVILYTGMAGATRNQTLSTLQKIAETSVVRELLDKGAKLCGLYGEAPNAVLRPGPFLVRGIRLIASILHPDVFNVGEGVVCLER